MENIGDLYNINNMLKINLDEAYVFDLLAIYELKKNKGNKESEKSFLNLKEEIKHQLGYNLFYDIKDSPLYHNLYLSNEKVFNLVDRAGESEISKETANANYERYLAKKELQKQFFKEELTETKL